jgi:hypothetical protein
MRRRDTRSLAVAARERVGQRLLQQLRGAPAAVWLAAVALGLLWLPWVPGLGALGSSPGPFLQALWQVEGAALGLSLAVVLFAFQAVYGQRRAATLGEFAEETWLFPIFYVGLLGLVIDGAVLLGGGRGAPGGWAATWAVVWAVGTALSLAWLFVRTVRALEPAELQALRLRRIGHDLHRFLAAVEIDSPLLLESAQKDMIAVSARREGEISDIKLHRLARAAAHADRLELKRRSVRSKRPARQRTPRSPTSTSTSSSHFRRRGHGMAPSTEMPSREVQMSLRSPRTTISRGSSMRR